MKTVGDFTPPGSGFVANSGFVRLTRVANVGSYLNCFGLKSDLVVELGPR
jgi:hypothetical protein